MPNKSLERIIRVGVWVVVAVIFTLVGNFVYWPLLTRAVLLYSAIIVVSMIRLRPMTAGERELDRAMLFWRTGFDRVNSILRERQSQSLISTGVSAQDVVAMGMWLIACGVFWTGIVALVQSVLK